MSFPQRRPPAGPGKNSQGFITANGLHETSSQATSQPSNKRVYSPLQRTPSVRTDSPEVPDSDDELDHRNTEPEYVEHHHDLIVPLHTPLRWNAIATPSAFPLRKTYGAHSARKARQSRESSRVRPDAAANGSRSASVASRRSVSSSRSASVSQTPSRARTPHVRTRVEVQLPSRAPSRGRRPRTSPPLLTLADAIEQSFSSATQPVASLSRRRSEPSMPRDTLDPPKRPRGRSRKNTLPDPISTQNRRQSAPSYQPLPSLPLASPVKRGLGRPHKDFVPAASTPITPGTRSRLRSASKPGAGDVARAPSRAQGEADGTSKRAPRKSAPAALPQKPTAGPSTSEAPVKAPRGRPKGSKNRPKDAVEPLNGNATVAKPAPATAPPSTEVQLTAQRACPSCSVPIPPWSEYPQFLCIGCRCRPMASAKGKEKRASTPVRGRAEGGAERVTPQVNGKVGRAETITRTGLTASMSQPLPNTSTTAQKRPHASEDTAAQSGWEIDPRTFTWRRKSIANFSPASAPRFAHLREEEKEEKEEKEEGGNTRNPSPDVPLSISQEPIQEYKMGRSLYTALRQCLSRAAKAQAQRPRSLSPAGTYCGVGDVDFKGWWTVAVPPGTVIDEGFVRKSAEELVVKSELPASLDRYLVKVVLCGRVGSAELPFRCSIDDSCTGQILVNFLEVSGPAPGVVTGIKMTVQIYHEHLTAN